MMVADSGLDSEVGSHSIGRADWSVCRVHEDGLMLWYVAVVSTMCCA